MPQLRRVRGGTDDADGDAAIAPAATHAVIDGLTESMHMLDLSPYDHTEGAGFYGQLARPSPMRGWRC